MTLTKAQIIEDIRHKNGFTRKKSIGEYKTIELFFL